MTVVLHYTAFHRQPERRQRSPSPYGAGIRISDHTSTRAAIKNDDLVR